MSNRRRFFSNSNPMASEERYYKVSQSSEFNSVDGGRMTKQGAINKSFLLAGIVVATACVSAIYPSMGLFWFGFIGSLVCFFIAMYKPATLPITAPLYAAFEGLLLGTISIMYAAYAGGADGPAYGIIGMAVMATLGVLFTMLVLYKTGIIKPTEKLRSVLMTAMGAILVLYLGNMVMHLVGFGGIPYLHTAHPIGIVISLVIIGVAALSLVFDFQTFDRGEEMGAPKIMEWNAALGLLVTLVWLYIEILRLIAIFSGRD